MTLKDMAELLSLEMLTVPFDESLMVNDCYIGDLLSWVMGRAPESCVWITVMGNVNAVAVAKLADISAIILCENAHLDDEAKTQANQNQIHVYQSDKTAFQLAAILAEAFGSHS